MAAAPRQVEQRVLELGLVLPPVLSPAANYANAIQTGNLLYLSGTVPVADGVIPKGKVGADVSTEQARDHARLVALHQLAILREELGRHPCSRSPTARARATGLAATGRGR